MAIIETKASAKRSPHFRHVKVDSHNDNGVE
jgi:hypothetical protein